MDQEQYSAVSKSEVDESTNLSEPALHTATLPSIHESTKELILEVEFVNQPVHVMKGFRNIF